MCVHTHFGICLTEIFSKKKHVQYISRLEKVVFSKKNMYSLVVCGMVIQIRRDFGGTCRRGTYGTDPNQNHTSIHFR